MAATSKSQYEAFRALERTACERFVREHYEQIYRWLYRLTGGVDVAEDLTQESFAAFWASLQRTTPDVPPRVWLYSIARNQWRKNSRNQNRNREQTREHFDECAGSQASPSAALEQEEFAAAVEAALAELAPEFREVFSLRVWHELDYSQIAAVQGISADLARWRFFRARRLVRDCLSAWQHVGENSHGG